MPEGMAAWGPGGRGRGVPIEDAGDGLGGEGRLQGIRRVAHRWHPRAIGNHEGPLERPH